MVDLRKTSYIAAALAAAMFFSGCRSSAEYVEGEMFAMDTYMTWEVLEEKQKSTSEGLKQVISETEQLLSVTREDSDLYQLNTSAGHSVTVDAALAELLSRCLDFAEQTDGALNPALYPLVKAWGFTTGEHRVPVEEERKALLAYTDWREIQISENTVTLPESMELDFGAVGKGYLTDQCVDYLTKNQVKSALLRLGGNIYALGSKTDGSDWRVGIELPFSDGELAGVLSVQNRAVITSGNYQRYFEQDGHLYHHIIDGKTGAPAESGLNSVTVIAHDGLTGDALSTAYFVMGLEASAEDWRNREDIEVIWITENGKICYTEGLADCFTAAEGLETELIRR